MELAGYDLTLAAWGQACKTYLHKIRILQKRAIRLLYFADQHDRAIPLFLKANVLTITFLYYKYVSTLMHDINNDKALANHTKSISENV